MNKFFTTKSDFNIPHKKFSHFNQVKYSWFSRDVTALQIRRRHIGVAKAY